MMLDAYINWIVNTWHGRVFGALAIGNIITRVFDWEMGLQIVLVLVSIQALILMSYGISWVIKKLVGFIAGEFRQYVRKIVHEELRSSSRVY